MSGRRPSSKKPEGGQDVWVCVRGCVCVGGWVWVCLCVSVELCEHVCVCVCVHSRMCLRQDADMRKQTLRFVLGGKSQICCGGHAWKKKRRQAEEKERREGEKQSCFDEDGIHFHLGQAAGVVNPLTLTHLMAAELSPSGWLHPRPPRKPGE